ncbi:23857_t:CDS:2, partial [Dentiscutata erythropus]
LQTINESDDGWNTDISDELQESNLLTWNFDNLPNSSHSSNSSASSSTINKSDNIDDSFSEIIQLGSRGNWVLDKKQNWVLAVLSPAFTKMAYIIWINILFTTNAGKFVHATINTTGRNLSLVAAIQRSANFDSHQWSTAITYEKTNVHDSYHNKSSLQHTINSAKRKHNSNESSITYEQEQQLNIDYKKLTVQKNLNDELEREIKLHQQLKSLYNFEPNNNN